MMTGFAGTQEFIYYPFLDNLKYQHALLCNGGYSFCCWHITFRDTTLQMLMVNIVDTLLLVDLNLLAFLTLFDSPNSIYT